MGKTVPADNIRLKRAYEAPSPEDGARILVDRLWPRGVTKDSAAIDHWAKDLSPQHGATQAISGTIPTNGTRSVRPMRRSFRKAGSS